MRSGSLRYTGITSYYWGGTAFSSELLAHNLNFGGATVNLSDNVSRWIGFTIRAKTSPNTLYI